jgi:RNA polymerase sigma-70 factor (ECF subfamily)
MPYGIGAAAEQLRPGHRIRNWDFLLSNPPNERALRLPLIWDKARSRSLPQSNDAVTPVVSDEDLLARLQSGDASALSLLFERYGRVALGIALRILRDAGEAEDIVQESFLYIYQKASHFDPLRGDGRSWILHIVYHRAFDRRGYLGRRGFYAGTSATFVEDALLGSTDLDREVGSRLDREQLKKAFAQLEERQRRTLELFYFDSLDLREISEVLGEPLGNVRHHYYRGLQKLRKSAFVKKLGKKVDSDE